MTFNVESESDRVTFSPSTGSVNQGAETEVSVIVNTTSPYLENVIVPFNNTSGNNLGNTTSRLDIYVASEGNLYAWGGSGKFLGVVYEGEQVTSPTPVLAAANSSTPLGNIVAVSAGSRHTLALKSDGTVWSWGSDTKEVNPDKTQTETEEDNWLKLLLKISSVSESSESFTTSKRKKWGSSKNIIRCCSKVNMSP